LFFSIAALATSIYAIQGGSAGGGSATGKQVVISKQYDKGRTLQKAQATNKPIIVFFYTDWCGFCQKFIPITFLIFIPKSQK
jgi:thiol:disulfide interchange protein